MTLFTREIYSREPEPFLTVGKVMIGLILLGFLALILNVVLLRAENEMREAESMQN